MALQNKERNELMSRNSAGNTTGSNASNGEVELWRGRTHFKMLFKPAAIQVLLLFLHAIAAIYVPSVTGWQWWDNWGQFSIQSLLIALSLWYVIVPLLRWKNDTFELTNKRVVKNLGILYRHSLEIPLQQITSISVERGILDRIFKCGTLNFQDASSSLQKTSGSWNRAAGNRDLQGVRFYDVPGVLDVKKLIDEARYGN